MIHEIERGEKYIKKEREKELLESLRPVLFGLTITRGKKIFQTFFSVLVSPSIDHKKCWKSFFVATVAPQQTSTNEEREMDSNTFFRKEGGMHLAGAKIEKNVLFLKSEKAR